MSTEKEKFAQRLNAVLDEQFYPDVFEQRTFSLAHALYLQPAVISVWLKGEDFPKTSELVRLSQLLKVRSNWLLLGVGSKLAIDVDNVKEIQVREPSDNYSNTNSLNKEAHALARDWMKLPLPQRNALATLIKTMVIQHSQCSVEQLKESP